MNKKNLKYLSVFAASMLALSPVLNAEVLKEDQNYYVIGSHLFTEDAPALTTKVIMKAAKTIEDNTEADDLSNMVIYSVENGEWLDILNGNKIVTDEIPDAMKDDKYYDFIDLEGENTPSKPILKGGLTIENPRKLGEFNPGTSDDEVAMGANVAYNNERISVELNGSNIVVTENKAMKAYSNGHGTEEWYAILVNLGIDPTEKLKDDEGNETAEYRLQTLTGYTGSYGIEVADRNATNMGAQEGELILWLKGGDTDNQRLIVFQDKANNESLAVTVEFKAAKGETYNRKAEANDVVVTDNSKVVYDKDATGVSGTFTIPADVTNFEFTDGSVKMIAKKINGTWKFEEAIVGTDTLGLKATLAAGQDANTTANTNAISKVETTKTDKAMTLTVTKTSGFKSYENASTKREQWFPVIVDLGVNPRNLNVTYMDGDTSATYNIDEIDITDANRWGATTDTAFVLWTRGRLTAGNGVTYTFTNKNNADITYAVTIKTVNDYPSLELNNATKLDADTFNNEQYTDEFKDNIIQNIKGINISKENNTITVTQTGVLSKYNNKAINEDLTWFGVVVDLGIDPSKLHLTGYTIEATDYSAESKAKFGITSPTAFIMWLRAEKAINGEFKYTVTSDIEENDSLELTIKFMDKEVYNYTANGEVTVNALDAKYDSEYHGFVINKDVTSFDFKDGNTKKTAAKENNIWASYSKIELVSASIAVVPSDIDTDETSKDKAEYIRNNINHLEVQEITSNMRTITVKRTGELSKYANGAGTQGAWYPLIIDLGIDPAELTSEGYTIESADYDEIEKARWGATGETEFLLWLNAEQGERVITFKNKNNINITYTVIISVQ